MVSDFRRYFTYLLTWNYAPNGAGAPKKPWQEHQHAQSKSFAPLAKRFSGAQVSTNTALRSARGQGGAVETITM